MADTKLPSEIEAQVLSILRKHNYGKIDRERTLQETLNKYYPKPFGKKRTYKQDWSSYNQAQTKEKIMLFYLLNDLLDNIPFPEKKKGCRKPIPIRDQIFYMVIQAYNFKSSRRVISDIEICRRLGLINETPHFNSVLKCLSNPKNSYYLKHLVNISGLPLAQVETDFAVDSSGFSTSQFDRWLDVRFDKDKYKDIRRFRKCHITCGVKTNIITAVNVTKGYSGDSPEFVDLIETTNKVFDIHEVSADKAYSARKNLQAVSQLGGIAFIPFKSNSTGRPKGPAIWRKMFDFYHQHRDEFLKRYHKRSNSETCFHMLKMKFSKHLRSKKETGQDNEILAKCLAHNLCVLIQESFELGIDINFKKGEKVALVK